MSPKPTGEKFKFQNGQDHAEQVKGLIDVVRIDYAIDAYNATGTYNDHKVLITNGAGFVGKDALVVFDYRRKLENDSGNLGANFVSTYIPPNFTWKHANNYVLLGFLEAGMYRHENGPDMFDLKNHFSFGNIAWIYFINHEFSKPGGIYSINSKNRIMPHDFSSLDELLKKQHLPNPYKALRIMFTDSLYVLSYLENLFYQKSRHTNSDNDIVKNITPIFMQSFRKPRIISDGQISDLTKRKE